MIGFSGVIGALHDALPHVGEDASVSGEVHLFQGPSFTCRALNDTRPPAVHRDERWTSIVIGDIFDSGLHPEGNAALFVLESLTREGPLAAAQHNGSYAFFIADYVEERVFIGLDRNTLIPLYYICEDERVFFSWDLSWLTRQSSCAPRIDEEALCTWLLLGGRGFSDQTRLEGVARLEPGAVATIHNGALTVAHSTPFHYRVDDASEDELLDTIADALIQACASRMQGRTTLLGLSGGLDSRILLAAAAHAGMTDRLITYTHGVQVFRERAIAKQIAAHVGVSHHDVRIPPTAYIPAAAEGLRASGGMSIFKHGVHVFMHRMLRQALGVDQLIYGSALDLMLASTHAPAPIYSLSDRDALTSFYQDAAQEGGIKNYLRFNLPQERFVSLFQDAARGRRAVTEGIARLALELDKIPGEHPVDINDALAMEIRIKRWYNPNLIFALRAYPVQTPTYDHAVMDAIMRVPWQLRRNGDFRRKLFLRLDTSLADIPLDTTMQPARLAPERAAPFAALEAKRDAMQQDLWFTNDRLYLPSDRFDANFLEWFRIYPAYDAFLREVLLGPDAMMIQSLFDSNEVARIIDEHHSGVANHHKFLQMLISAELMYRIFVGGHEAPKCSPLLFLIV